MRVRNCNGSLSAEDTSQCFLLSRCVLYLDRLLARYPKLDYEILETIHWVLGSEIVEEDLLPLAFMLDAGERRRRFERELQEEVHNSRDFAHLMDQALRKTRRNEQLAVIDLFRGLLNKRLDQLQCSGTSDIEKNLNLFQQMFGLSELEKELCLFFLIIVVYEEAQSLFEHHLKCDHYAGRGYLAAILQTTPSEISKSMSGKLSQIGILESGRGGVCLERDFLRLLQNTDEADIDTEFFKRIHPETLSLDAHNVEGDATRHALSLLAQENTKGCALLLYGNPGVGKTSYAYGLGQAHGLDIYICKHEGKDKDWQRRAALMASANMVSQNPKSLLIVDDCDSILGTRHLWSFFGSYNDKRWLHEVLESRAKTIFIVNDVRFLEESVIRRFDFSIHFKPFSRIQRKRIWETILTDYRLDSFFDTTETDRLAAQFEVSAGVIEQAVKKAVEIGSNAKEEIYNAIILSLEAHDCLINGGNKPVRIPKIDHHSFSIEGLNVSGVHLTSLLKELEVFDEYLKTPGNDDAASMSLLFYGVSGAGKSFLARFIAQHLGKEVVFKRASDILSKWVGESEQNVRACFEEAARKEAVLVVDEVDLIGNRDRATHTWEVSLVNEFLTSMESYPGIIQIYTTNRLTDLDSATLRRFVHKVEFHCLKPEGIVVFYRKLLAPLVGYDLEKELEQELKGIGGLTPGDFAVVKSKFQFKSPNEMSHEALVGALKEEAKVKEIHSGKKAVGF